MTRQVALRNAKPFADLKIAIKVAPVAAGIQQVATTIRSGKGRELLARKNQPARIHRFRHARFDVFQIQRVFAQPRCAQAEEFIRARSDAAAAIEIIVDALRKSRRVEWRCVVEQDVEPLVARFEVRKVGVVHSAFDGRMRQKLVHKGLRLFQRIHLDRS